MSKNSRTKIISILILFVMIFTSTTTLAVWWGTPGYEWALANRLTSVKTVSQLKKEVSLTDFYSTVIK